MCGVFLFFFSDFISRRNVFKSVVVLQDYPECQHTNELPLFTVLYSSILSQLLYLQFRGHGGTVVTHSPPTSEVGGSNPNVGKLVVTYRWSAVYSTEP